ncbi:unnamed protein product, partial [Allacma fusca]
SKREATANGENNNVDDCKVNDDPEDDKTNEEDKQAFIITNTTLSILRLYGRYLHMMHLLKSIAYDVAVCMSQLFEYYFYVVFVYFGSENGTVTIETISNAQLRVALSRIRDNLIKRDTDGSLSNGKVRIFNE